MMTILQENSSRLNISRPAIIQRTKDNKVNIMKKDVSIENWVIRGTVFILIFTIGCFIWFQYQMSITEQYDNNYKVEPQHIDESSQTEQEDIIHIESNDAAEQEATEKNSTENSNSQSWQS